MSTFAILDSGVGGLALLKRLYFSIPADYIYFADTANFPFGTKSQSELLYIAESAVLRIQKNHPTVKTIAVACNTLSLATLPYLKKVFPDIAFLGCEPPIRQALQYTVSKPLLVATEFTVEKIKKNGYTSDIFCCALPNLAKLVEQATPEREILAYLNESLKSFSNFDCIVLGCTHYSVAKTCFSQLFPAVKIFDSIDGAYATAKKLFRKKRQKGESTLQFEFSADSEENTQRYEKLLHEMFKYY